MNSRLFAVILVLIVGGAGAYLYFHPRDSGTSNTPPAPAAKVAPALMTVDPATPYDDDGK
jgi:hypothetical protein